MNSPHCGWICHCSAFEIGSFVVVVLHNIGIVALVEVCVYLCVECNKILLWAANWMVFTLVWGNTPFILVVPLLWFVVSLLLFWWCHCDALLLFPWCCCHLHCDAHYFDFDCCTLLWWCTPFPKQQRNNPHWWLVKEDHLAHLSDGQ